MDERGAFQNKIEDMIRLSEKRGFSVSAFLSLEERVLSEKYLSHRQGAPAFLFFGGAAGAERCCLILGEYASEEDAGIVCLKIENRDKKVLSLSSLSHRDVLGALLSLGIERDAVGDVVAYNDGFIVFIRESVAQLVLDCLSRIGRESVDCKRITLPANYTIEKAKSEEAVVCASLRADCLVGAICRLSREEAKALIVRGDLKRNHEDHNRPDALVREGDILSIRHFGRFEVGAVLGATRSDRIRVRIYRYV